MTITPLSFKIMHSARDADHPPEQLAIDRAASPSAAEIARGWKTPSSQRDRHRSYPKELILRLSSGPCYISKLQILFHHFNIATEIEVYIGYKESESDDESVASQSDNDSDNEEDESIVYMKYDCVLDSNQRACFKSPKLKSIKIDTEGEYVKLVIIKCHQIGLNQYNQVGIVAIDISGEYNDSIKIPFEHPEDSTNEDSDEGENPQPLPQPIPHQQQALVVLDEELREWFMALVKVKEDAIKLKDLSAAETYEQLINMLNRAAEEMAKFNATKHKAVEAEDFDEVDRLNAKVEYASMECMWQITESGIMLNEYGEVVAAIFEEDLEMDRHATDDHITPMMNHNSHRLDNSNEGSGAEPNAPEELTADQRCEFELPIHVFGERVIACLLSKKFQLREYALTQVTQRVEDRGQGVEVGDEESDTERNEEVNAGRCRRRMHPKDVDKHPKVDKVLLSKATFSVIQQGLSDSRERVSIQALTLWESLTIFCVDNLVPVPDIYCNLEQTLHFLLNKIADTSPLIKQRAIDLIVNLSNEYCSPPCAVLPLVVHNNIKVIQNHKWAKEHVELVKQLVEEFGVTAGYNQTGITLDAVMDLSLAYLKHNHIEVREAAKHLVVAIFEKIGLQSAESYLCKMKPSLARTIRRRLARAGITVVTSTRVCILICYNSISNLFRYFRSNVEETSALAQYSRGPLSSLTAPDRLKRLLNRLTALPGHNDKLNDPWKQYSKGILLSHLRKLGIQQLEPFLAWIPSEHFIRIEKLGQGGCSKVYKGTFRDYKYSGKYMQMGIKDIHDVESLALKELTLEMLPELVFNVLLLRTNPNIVVPIIGLSQHPETMSLLMVMPLVEHGTLETAPALTDWKKVAATTADLAKALAVFHIDYCHGDLHPGNVALINHSLAKTRLMDLGHCRLKNEIVNNTGVYGRLDYLPPEIFKHKPHTTASDVYCFGTLLWQMVTGMSPRKDAQYAIAKFPGSLREELIQGAPFAFNNVLRQCWNPDPEQRPSMNDIYNMLLKWKSSYVGESWPFSNETLTFIKRQQVAREMMPNSESHASFLFIEGTTSFIPFR